MYINNNILDNFKTILSDEGKELLLFQTDNLTINLDLELFYMNINIHIDNYNINLEKTCDTYEETISFINGIINCIDSNWEITNENLKNLR